MGSWFKLPVSVTDVGAVVGFVAMVAVSMAIINRVGPVKRLVS
jgi:hypothetical protein